ncbi:MAG TPA: hypothetical protein VMV27_17575 [Candidatus Binataceae bacterium]|nr:hypothetical protein [Candidatus Binataceae bacterium]
MTQNETLPRTRASNAIRQLGAAALAAVMMLGAAASGAHAQASSSLFEVVPSGAYSSNPLCLAEPWYCTDTPIPYKRKYIGHDEPAVLFYSSTPGAGNSSFYNLTIPTEPSTPPQQNGTGGTWNFMLHPAFWFGMAMCDTQSAPNYTNTCTPDSDSNIFDNPNTKAADYIGHHPGTAFMEMQFYPPGWIYCSARQWCAALTIDEYSYNQNTGQQNNASCQSQYGPEPIQDATITTTGNVGGPSFLMNAGDDVQVQMYDTSAGFTVVLKDVTTGTQGSMTASTANGFQQVVFNPNATTCTTQPYAYHPMYSTSSVHTRVPWAAHSYNIAFADEIGHFEFCDSVDTSTGDCTSPGVQDSSLDSDDTVCYAASQSTNVQVSGCTNNDTDFDGIAYGLNWPGTNSNPTQDALMHPAPIRFSSPAFQDSSSGNTMTDYTQAAFEDDMPTFEQCTQFPSTCSNPPSGAAFYPIFTASSAGNTCVWQLGGASFLNLMNDFGGTSTAEYGNLVQLAYPAKGGVGFSFTDYRQILSNNPCPQLTAAPPSPTATATPTATPTPVTAVLQAKPRRIVLKAGASRPVTMINKKSRKQDQTINVGSIDSSNPEFAPSGACVSPIAPGGRCEFSVGFTPSQSGTHQGTLTISSDAANPAISIELIGKVKAPKKKK